MNFNRPLNASLLNPLWGSTVFFIVGILLAHWVLRFIGNEWPFFWAKIMLGLTFALTYYVLCLQDETKTGHRGIVYFFQNTRFRMGPDGLGFLEGPNATPLPKGIMNVKDENTLERTMELGVIDEYSLNDVLVGILASAQWKIIDGYLWQSVEKGEDALRNIIEPTFRDVIMDHFTHAAKRTVNGIETDTKGIIDEKKEEFSDRILQLIRARLDANAQADDKTLVSSKMVKVISLQARAIRLPETMDASLTQRENEHIEREAGLIQARTRRLQIAELRTRPDGTASDIDEATALSAMLVDDEKEGAENINLTIGKSVAEALTSAGGGGLDLNMLMRFFGGRGGRSKGTKGGKK